MAGDDRKRTGEPPLALDPIDLLAGIAPGVELTADDLPPGIDADAPALAPMPARTTVAETGRLIRSGDRTVRRLIRTRVLRPRDPADPAEKDDDAALDRAGVVPRTPDKPGE